MKQLIVLSAVLALAGGAHAKTVTVEYTAKVSFLTKNQLWGGSSESLSSITLSDGTIRQGQTLTGNFTYDDSAAPASTYHDRFYDAASYVNPAAAIKLTADFGAGGAKVTAATNAEASVHDEFTHVGYDDRLQISGYSVNPDTSPIYRALSFDFFSHQPAALLGTALPGAAIANFDGATFDFNEWHAESGIPYWIDANGSITSWHVVSAVPEPSMFAMMAASLGLLAWRRKRG